MVSENGNAMVMPVAPTGGTGFGGFGQDGLWILLLLLICGGGWGNGFGGFGGMGGLAADGAMLYPWMNQSQQINDGFRDQMINGSINGIQSSITTGFGDVQNALCGGFAGVNATVNGAQNAIAQQMYSNQIADLERSFAVQTANTAAMSGLQSQLAQCCCDNRLATCQTQNIIQNEGNATRIADANNTRDLLTNQTDNTRAILDKLCQLELDNVKAQVEAKNDRISELQTQLNMANLAASQTAQTSRLLADNAAQTVALEQYLNPAPIPAYVVQNPSCCSPNYGCGCAA